MKSKFISLLTAGMTAFFFAACSGDSSSDSTTNPIAGGEEAENVESSADAGEPAGTGDDVNSATSSATTTSSAAGSDVAKKYKYYGAELTGVEQFTYGKFEAKMKMVAFPGTVSSMFTYYDPSWKKGAEPWNEIDIEILGKDATKWQSNLITREANGPEANNTSEEYLDLGFDATKDFHTYVIEWTPEYIAWYIDGKEIRKNKVGESVVAGQDQVDFMTKQQSLRFNLWASKSAAWTGKFTGEELADGPVAQEIEYVKVYSYDEATKTFTELWVDEFESAILNRKHWDTGYWDMENVTLKKANVVIEDGKLKLLMTREEVAE